MRQYQEALNKLSYGNAVVLYDHLPVSWIDANLIKESLWRTSGVNGEDYYVGEIVFYSCTSTQEGDRVYAFRNPENKRRVLARLDPLLIVEANPEGPDLCPKCGGLENPPPPARVAVEITSHRSSPKRAAIDLLGMLALGIGIGWMLFA